MTPKSHPSERQAIAANRKPAFRNALIYAALAFAVACACALAQPLQAQADEAPADVPRSASGSCYIGDTWMIGDQSFFTIPSFSGLLSGAVPASSFECLNHSAAAPEHVDADYDARLTGCSLEGGWVEYYVTITPPDATDGVTSNELGLIGYQRVGGTVRLAWDFKGGIALQKQSALPDITDGNGCYSLKGALYGVYSSREAAATHDRAQSLRMLATGEDGVWETGMDFTIGTYYVAEVEAPRGFVLDDGVYEVAVTPNQTARVNASPGYVQDVPRTNPVTLWASKTDAETPDGKAQGTATLAGAQFTVSYYDGFYDAASLPAEPTRTWVVAADESGQVAVDDANKVAGDDFYRLADGRITLPLGTVTIAETQAPEGYLPDAGGMRIVQIRDGGTTETVSAYEAPAFSDAVVRGGVSIGKVDRQNGGFLPQGSATLEGAVFSIVSANPQPVLVDGTLYAPGQIVKTVETRLDEDGRYRASTASDCLPYGTYIAYESESPAGYVYDGASQSWSHTFSIGDDGIVVDLSDEGSSAANRVIRGDFAFSKIDGLSAERLGLVPFMVTSQTTGEAHVIVTDENGMVSTASDWNAHSANTNANDAAVVETETGYAVDERLLDPLAGVWFDGRADAACEVLNDLGALPYDTYTVSELRAPGNEGYDLATFDVIISRDGRELDLGTVDDSGPESDEPEEPGQPSESEPAIETEFTDSSDGDHEAADDSVVTLVDRVSYNGLVPGDVYTVAGTLHVRGEDGSDAGAARDASGREIMARQSFIAGESDGEVEVAFTFAASDLGGANVVAYEQLERKGAVLATHADISNEAQTVAFAKEPEEPIVETPPETPAVETPEKETPKPEQPTEETKPETSVATKASAMPKTGDTLFGIALVMIPAGALGLALAALSVRKLERETQIIIERGKPRM